MPPLSQPRSRYGLPSLPALTDASTDLRQRVVADMRALAPTGMMGGGYGNYQAMQTIPGTATNWTLDNPGPNPPPLNPWLQDSKPWALRRNPNQGTPPPAGAASSVTAQQPWFQSAFDPSLNKPELPWWMRR